MIPLTNHDEIVKRCLELDDKSNKAGLWVYYITLSKHTFQLIVDALLWNALAENEKYCMAKFGNLFLDEDEAKAARDRVFTPEVPHG